MAFLGPIASIAGYFFWEGNIHVANTEPQFFRELLAVWLYFSVVGYLGHVVLEGIRPPGIRSVEFFLDV